MTTKYYSIKKILALNAQYNLIYGKRSNGKSYQIKKYFIEQFINNGEEFIILRRYKSDITKALADIYFDDMPIDKLTRGKYNTIYTQAGRVYMALLDDNGRRTNPTLCGYFRALAEAQRYSSGAYPRVKNIALEEFISLDGVYLPNEIMLFRHVVSTVARVNDIRVFMVANTISRLSPYFREFGIKNIEKQALGTIDIYEQETDGGMLKIACEYCADTTLKSRMFFGEDSKMVNSGKWLTKDYPHADISLLEKSEQINQFVVEYNSTRFLCSIMCTNDLGFYLYVVPKTTEIKPYTPVYTNKVYSNIYYKRGLKPTSVREKSILDLIDTKCFFCDNLTATEFYEAIKHLRNVL